MRSTALSMLLPLLPACLVLDTIRPMSTRSESVAGDDLDPAVPDDAATTPGDTAAPKGATGSTAGTGITTSTCAELNLSVTEPPVQALHYGSHDVLARTLSFTHTGDAVACSHDGGTTFAACDTSTTLIYTLADHALWRELVIRASLGATCTAEHRYVPKASHPRVTFHSCDVLIATSESLANLDDRMTSDNLTLCIGAGVAFANPRPQNVDLAVVVDHSNVRLLGIEGAPFLVTLTTSAGFFVPYGANGVVIAHAVIQSSATGNHALKLGGGEGTVLSNVRIDAPTTLGTYLILDQSTGATATVLQRSTLTLGGTDAAFVSTGALMLEDSLIDTQADVAILTTSGSRVDLVRSSIRIAGGGLGAIRAAPPTPATAAQGLTLSATDSSVDNAAGPALLLDLDSTANLTRVLLAGHGSTAVLSLRRATVTMNFSTVRTASVGIAVDKAASGPSSLTIGSSTIRRIDAAPTGGAAMALSNGPTLNFGAGSMANVFCSESQQGANTFAALVTGVPGAGSYNLVVHHNQTLTACP